ncbi:unnamed protein product [Bursaphelenchus xylophilus]|uniref:(pine wood nematode) hypothetical protein n=1 Tax=Bursaphelenchus xylophilus TaxID=6326 RepID=A0A1I7RTW2_BURXY|nr:unnamed protein product [Bursaphelenchus xylophilus]CAG9132145.1 unnamed protein product [Bursaphelenchus xylophilus]
MFERSAVVTAQSIMELCELAETVQGDPYIMCVQNLQLPLALLSIYAMWQITRSVRYKKVVGIASPALRTLFLIIRISFYLRAIFAFSLYVYTMLRVNFYERPCHVAWTVGECITVRIPNYFALFTVCLTHVALMVDRLGVTFYRRHYEGGWTAAFFYSTAIVSLSAVSCYHIYGQEDFRQLIFACITSSSAAQYKLVQVMITLLVLDLITAFGDTVAFYENRKRFFNKINYYEFYSLDKSMDLRENRMSIRVVLPMSIIHLSLTLPLVASFPIGRQLEWHQPTSILLYVESISLIQSLYFLMSPIILSLCYVCNEEGARDEWLGTNQQSHADEHFRQLQSQLKLQG